MAIEDSDLGPDFDFAGNAKQAALDAQPVTFEALKRIIGHCRNGADLPHLPYPSHCLSENCIRCRLEALEQQVWDGIEDLEQKAMFNESQRTHNSLEWKAVAFEQKRIVEWLTALLGKP